MNKQFVTYEIALKLKELGFNEECFGWFLPEKENVLVSIANVWYNHAGMSYTKIKAPLWQQAVSFLAEKYNMIVAAANEVERENQILMFIKLINK